MKPSLYTGVVLAALLAFSAATPMSLCAAMANLPADCVPTPHCEEMGAAQPEVTLTAPVSDCCQMTSAPVPERTQNAPAPVVSLDSVASHEALELASPAWHPAPASTVARSAPLDLQPVLCVFLI